MPEQKWDYLYGTPIRLEADGFINGAVCADPSTPREHYRIEVTPKIGRIGGFPATQYDVLRFAKPKEEEEK
jgi:hypothetical protein